MKKISVFIVDDHDIVRRGLQVSIESFVDFCLIGEANSAELAIEMCSRLQPDVVLLDLVMPSDNGLDGVAAVKGIRKGSPRSQVVALSNFRQEKLVHDVLSAGATGYLLKNVSIDELANAIRTAYTGNAVLAPEAAEILMRRHFGNHNRNYGLTRRETEVLRLMVEGKNNPEIAAKLSISRSTVKNHISNIFSKLAITNRTEAVALAIHQGLVADSRELRDYV